MTNPAKAAVRAPDPEAPDASQMQIAQEPCPPQGDSKYIWSVGLDGDRFRQILTYWKSVSSSAEGMDHAFDKVARNNTSSRYYPDLKALVLSGRADPQSIRRIGPPLTPLRGPVFELRLSNPKDDNLSYLIQIQQVGDVFQIAALRLAIA